MNQSLFDQQRQQDAEDRHLQQQSGGNQQYQPMQNSSFNASMQLATMFERRRDNDDSFVEHSAFAYNEHRRNNFKRDRSFSNSQDGNDDMISCGSSINAEDGFDQCAYNNYPVLDLDDDYDLIADLDQDKKLDKSSIHNSANITAVVQNPIEQNLDIQDDAVYVGQREESCCEEQLDLGHESTFHSINEQQLHESLNDLGLGGAVLDNSLDLTIGNTTENFRSFLVTSPRVVDQSFEPHGADDKQVLFSDEVQQNLKLDEQQLSITKMQRQVSGESQATNEQSGKMDVDQVYTQPESPQSLFENPASDKDKESISQKIQKVKKEIGTKEKKTERINKKSKPIQKKAKVTTVQKMNAKSNRKKLPKVIEFDPNNVISQEQQSSDQSTKDRSEQRRPKKGERTYYKNFDFFFKRTCFRTMTLYYKLAYKPLFDKAKDNKKTMTVMDSIIDMIKKEFPGLLDKLCQKSQFQFTELFKQLVLSHRHNKNDDFLKDPLVDFSVVRDPMYKYSQEAQDRFFSESVFSFLFAWFQAKPEAQAFAQEKFEENTDKTYPERLMKEVYLLSEVALKTMVDPVEEQPPKIQFLDKSASTKLAKHLNSYLKNQQALWISKKI